MTWLERLAKSKPSLQGSSTRLQPTSLSLGVCPILQGLQGGEHVCQAAVAEGPAILVPAHLSVQHNPLETAETWTLH